MVLSDFTPCVGQAFTVSYPGHEESLILDGADALPPTYALFKSADECFQLVFRGESTTIMLEQHIHRLTHPVLGALEIFLVPLRRNADGTHSYVATFS